jgi:hypothetical protein
VGADGDERMAQTLLLDVELHLGLEHARVEADQRSMSAVRKARW